MTYKDRIGKNRPPRPAYYETTSPFETFVPGSKPRTWAGLVDRSIVGTPGEDFSSAEVGAKLDPEQYDNPRGYPGLALVQTGDQRPKIPATSMHDITNHMSGEAKLARTGKPSEK